MTRDDRSRDIVPALLELLRAIRERGTEPRGRTGSDGVPVDHSVSVGSLEDALPGRRGDPRDSPVITTREYEEEVILAAELPGVRADDVTVHLDRAGHTATVIAVNEVLGRIPLDDREWTVADVSVNNHVLEVRITHD